MDYFVKKHINKKLIAKIIFEGLSFITILLWVVIRHGGPGPNITYKLFWILTIFSFLFSIIINLIYIKKQNFNSFTLPLFTTIFLFFLAVGTSFLPAYRHVFLYIDENTFIFSVYIILILISIGISINIQLILLRPGKQNLIIQKSKEEEKIK